MVGITCTAHTHTKVQIMLARSKRRIILKLVTVLVILVMPCRTAAAVERSLHRKAGVRTVRVLAVVRAHVLKARVIHQPFADRLAVNDLEGLIQTLAVKPLALQADAP